MAIKQITKYNEFCFYSEIKIAKVGRFKLLAAMDRTVLIWFLVLVAKSMGMVRKISLSEN